MEHVVCRPLADCPIALHLAAAWRNNNAAPPLEAFLVILRERLWHLNQFPLVNNGCRILVSTIGHHVSTCVSIWVFIWELCHSAAL
jgi:hypothetical protein